MAVRIGDYVLAGELRNTRRNGVYGWIEFAPDYGIRIELTGNLSGELAGMNIRFRRRSQGVTQSDGVAATHRDPNSPEPLPPDLPEEVDMLADRQIGVVDKMEVRLAKVPTIPIEQFKELDESRRAECLELKRCLYLSWYSQNGRVVAEIVDPLLAVDDQPPDLSVDPESGDLLDGVGFTEVHLDQQDLDELDGEDLDEEDDPYGLFDENLERSVAESLGTSDVPAGPAEGGEESSRRSWDEVIPGLDPETKEMYERWDEIFEGKKDEPITYLFSDPLKLPKPENVTTDAEAEPLVKAILAQLARLSVAIDVCEHFTPLLTYRMLMTEILPTAKVHPNLAASEMVQHYSTSDFCAACEAEFEAEFGDEQGSDVDSSDDDASSEGPSSDSADEEDRRDKS